MTSNSQKFVPQKTNRAEYIIALSEVFASVLKTIEAKSCDYATNDDPFKNFRMAETLGFSMSEGILIRMSDKMSRIANLLQREAKVSDEKITDTLHDLIAYSAILLIYLQKPSV